MILLLSLITASAYVYLPLTPSLSRPPTSSCLQKDITLYEDEQILYLAQILIGNPPQTFSAAIDTTRSSTWFEGTNCKDCEKFEHEYDPLKSNTYRNLSTSSQGRTLKSCSYYGTLSSDFITLNTISSISSARINFTIASSETNCSNLNIDGALSFSSPSPFTNTPIVQVLKNSGEVSQAVFALFINNFTLSEKYSFPPAALEIGGFNLSRFSSDPDALFFVNSSGSYGTWSFEFDSVEFGQWIGDSSIITLSSTLRYVIGDLNAYIGFLPYLSLMGFDCEEIPNNFVIKCKANKKNQLPEFKFNIGGNSIVLPRYSIWQCDSKECTLKIQFNQAGSWTFGQIFLENYFTIYNYDNSSIGIAPAANSRLIDHDESSYASILTFCFFLGLASI